MTDAHRPGEHAPRAFPLDDRRVYDAYVAGRQSAALAVGVRSGLFERLAAARNGLDALTVARELEWSARGARSMLAALRAMGLVVEDEAQHFTLAPDAAAYLLRGRAGSLAGLVDLEVDGFLSPAALLEALASDRASVYGGEDPWEAHAQDPERARAFTAAMHAISERPAAGLAEVLDLSQHRRVLDVGGGSGALAIALARANPELECVVWDLSVVCPIADEYAAEAGVAARVSAAPGDMFAEPFPGGFDVVLLSQILHDWDEERGAELLAKARAALPADGLVVVHEKLVEENGGPLANALVNLDMLVWTEGQQYTGARLGEMLRAAGFGEVTERRTTGYWSVVVGR